MYSGSEHKETPVGKILFSGIIGLFILFLVFSSFGTIDAGNVGVKTRLGAVTGTIGQGFYAKMPFIDSVDVWDVQTQKEQVDSEAASSDLQNVNTTVAVNYNVDPSKVAMLFTTVGDDYQDKIIAPAIQEAVKAVTAKYTAEQLITQRAQVQSDIQSALTSRLGQSDILVSAVSIVNFNFSDQFNSAIEAKVTAEQNALAAKNKLDQVKYEAQQTVTSAQAQADAIKIQAEAINSQGGADYVALQAVNKWDGHLPNQMIPGQSLPFINVNAK